jgi:hypothetical protein
VFHTFPPVFSESGAKPKRFSDCQPRPLKGDSRQKFVLHLPKRRFRKKSVIAAENFLFNGFCFLIKKKFPHKKFSSDLKVMMIFFGSVGAVENSPAIYRGDI